MEENKEWMICQEINISCLVYVKAYDIELEETKTFWPKTFWSAIFPRLDILANA